MTDARVGQCACGKGGAWYADNNGARSAQWYCEGCEDRRADLWGCARMVSEGCGCVPSDPCACGCDGSGVLVKDYDPCSKCGTEYAETQDVAGFPLCEQCYNTWKCGCGTGCESCKEAE